MNEYLTNKEGDKYNINAVRIYCFNREKKVYLNKKKNTFVRILLPKLFNIFLHC